MSSPSGFYTDEQGRTRPITPRKPRVWPLVAVVAFVALAGGGVSASGAASGTAGSAGVGAQAGSLPGNLAGDVVDSLPGRDLATRRSQARSSAQRGRTAEAWSRLALKQLARAAEHQLDCVGAATGQVRAFLLRTPCTSLDRVLIAVGDGHGNAAVVSVVRVGFSTSADAQAFLAVEDTPASGDIRPLDIAAVLHLTGVTLTDEHYRSRRAGRDAVVAEAGTATGHVDGPVLDAVAETAIYLPVP